jgi:hypothetical protein
MYPLKCSLMHVEYNCFSFHRCGVLSEINTSEENTFPIFVCHLLYHVMGESLET